MFLKGGLDDETLIERIRRVLLPFEYTRVDNIVELVFETQQETEKNTSVDLDLEGAEDKLVNEVTGNWEFTPSAELEAKRTQVIDAFFQLKNKVPVKRSRTNYSDPNNEIGITCAISKKYHREYQPYWYALHPKWLNFMRAVKEAYFVLGCMDRKEAYALPLQLVESLLPSLNTTKSRDKEYWHVPLGNDEGSLALNLSSVGKKINLSPYAFRL